MPKMQVKKGKRKTRWPNVLVGGLLGTTGRSRRPKKEEEIQRKANLRLCEALKSQPRIDVLVGGIRTIKVKPLSKRRAKALNSLAESEHEPIKSDAFIYAGKRKSR